MVKYTSDPIYGIFGASRMPKGLICSYIGLLEASRRAPKVLKWVSDTYLVKIGQLDHFMVFGPKSRALKDFQRGKTCSIGVK